LSLETEGDILTLTQRIRSSLEAAASAVPNSPEQEAHRTLVVLGGGPTGVEAALLVKSLAQRIIQAMVPQPRIHPRVVLVHGSGQILSDPVFAPLRSQMTRQLQQAGIEVRLRHWVVSASPDAVTMKDADTGALTSLPTRTAINALGALPNPLGQTLGAAPEKRVPVNAYLESPQHTSVYIIGDLADARDGQGQSLPMLGQVAAQQGHYVAQDLLRKATGQLKPSLPFQYRHRGVTLPTSPQEALLQLPLPGGRSFVLKGRLASWLRHRLYQQKLNAVLPNS
jgi:NADH dehydrogenase